jgi:hypothetical protein
MLLGALLRFMSNSLSVRTISEVVPVHSLLPEEQIDIPVKISLVDLQDFVADLFVDNVVVRHMKI